VLYALNYRVKILLSSMFVILFLIGAYAFGGNIMKISSPEFEHNQLIPEKFTCQGADLSPRLVIEDIPEGTKTLALINDDPDAPGGTWDHWILFNIEPSDEGTLTIQENTAPGIQGKNSWGRNDYGGPCPPSGTHRYFFKLYALDMALDLPEGTSKSNLEKAMQEHILAKTEFIGLYKKS